MRKSLPLLLWTLSLLLLIASLQVVLPPYSYGLWQLQVGMTEFGHRLAGIPLFLAVVILLRRKTIPTLFRFQTAALLGVLVFSSLLFLLPSLWTPWESSRLQNELTQQLGTLPPEKMPRIWNWTRHWLALPQARATVERRCYPGQSGHELCLGIYRAENSAPSGALKPIVLVLHGGGWSGGDPYQLSELSQELASEGYLVATASYRFTPRFTWPAQLEDAKSALGYLKSHATSLGADPSRIFLLGRSAGGHLAQMLAYSASDPAIRGLISFYAPSDLQFGYAISEKVDILGSRNLIEMLLGGGPDRFPERYDDSSPLRYVSKNSPPTLLLHGRDDMLVWIRHSERLLDRLRALGVPCVLYDPRFATHGMDFSPSSPHGQLSGYAIRYFLRSLGG